MPIYKLHDSAGTPLNDPMLAIAMGAVDGVFHINKFGENEDVAADVPEDIWTGSSPYPYPTTASTVAAAKATRGKERRRQIASERADRSSSRHIAHPVTPGERSESRDPPRVRRSLLLTA